MALWQDDGLLVQDKSKEYGHNFSSLFLFLLELCVLTTVFCNPITEYNSISMENYYCLNKKWDHYQLSGTYLWCMRFSAKALHNIEVSIL